MIKIRELSRKRQLPFIVVSGGRRFPLSQHLPVNHITELSEICNEECPGQDVNETCRRADPAMLYPRL